MTNSDATQVDDQFEDKEGEELLANTRAMPNPGKSGYSFPVYFTYADDKTLTYFLKRVNQLSLEMGVQVRPINTDNDEDQKTLMRLIGATGYSGMVSVPWNPRLR